MTQGELPETPVEVVADTYFSKLTPRQKANVAAVVQMAGVLLMVASPWLTERYGLNSSAVKTAGIVGSGIAAAKLYLANPHKNIPT